MGKLASMPVSVLAAGDRKIRLWVHSWMMTHSAWSASDPIRMPVATIIHQGLPRSSHATATWNATIPAVIQKVTTLRPMRRRTSGCSRRIRLARPPWGIGVAAL